MNSDHNPYKGPAECSCFGCVLNRSSVGAGLEDVKRRGVEAHILDFYPPRRRRAR